MDIGAPQREIYVEPLVLPEPLQPLQPSEPVPEREVPYEPAHQD